MNCWSARGPFWMMFGFFFFFLFCMICVGGFFGTGERWIWLLEHCLQQKKNPTVGWQTMAWLRRRGCASLPSIILRLSQLHRICNTFGCVHTHAKGVNTSRNMTLAVELCHTHTRAHTRQRASYNDALTQSAPSRFSSLCLLWLMVAKELGIFNRTDVS